MDLLVDRPTAKIFRSIDNLETVPGKVRIMDGPGPENDWDVLRIHLIGQHFGLGWVIYLAHLLLLWRVEIINRGQIVFRRLDVGTRNVPGLGCRQVFLYFLVSSSPHHPQGRMRHERS